MGNVIFIVLPLAIINVAALVYNFYFNIDWNNWWAGGNLWLILNSVYLLWATFHSIFVSLEYPMWMKLMRITRFVSLIVASVYTAGFLILGWEWYRELYLVDDKSNYDAISVIWNMLLGYNLILHVAVMPANLFLIVKEISLEIF